MPLPRVSWSAQVHRDTGMGEVQFNACPALALQCIHIVDSTRMVIGELVRAILSAFFLRAEVHICAMVPESDQLHRIV